MAGRFARKAAELAGTGRVGGMPAHRHAASLLRVHTAPPFDILLLKLRPGIWVDRFRSCRIRVEVLATSTQFILERSVFPYWDRETMSLHVARPGP
jgi:hypothetical protein